MTVDDLKRIYGVFEDQELAPIFGKTSSAISVWRKKGVPPGIQMKVQESHDVGPTRSKKVIEALRGHYKLSVGDFAKMLDVGASTVSTWANRDNLNTDLVYRMCPGVRYEFLATGEGPMFTEGGIKTDLYGEPIPPELESVADVFKTLNRPLKTIILGVLERMRYLSPEEQQKEVLRMAENFGRDATR